MVDFRRAAENPWLLTVILVAVYAAVSAAIALWWIPERRAQYAVASARDVQWVAVRALPGQTRIEEWLIEPPPALAPGLFWWLPPKQNLVGRYTAGEVKSGAPVRVAELRPFPDLDPGAGAELVGVPAGEHPVERQLMLPGHRFQVCEIVQEKRVCQPDALPLAAIVCPDPQYGAGAQGLCQALLRVSKEQAAVIRNIKNPALLFAGIPAGQPGKGE